MQVHYRGLVRILILQTPLLRLYRPVNKLDGNRQPRARLPARSLFAVRSGGDGIKTKFRFPGKVISADMD